SAVPQTAGRPEQMSETQWEAAQRQRLQQSGALTDQDILDGIMGERSPVQVVGPNGAPQYASPGAAVRQGAQPFINKGAEAKPELKNYQTQDGRSGTAVYDDTVGWRDSQTGEVLPAGTQTYSAALTGGASETGLTTGTQASV